MTPETGRTPAKFLQYVAIWAFLGVAGLLPFRARARYFAFFGGRLIPLVPSLRKRMQGGLRRVFPEMPDAEMAGLMRRNAANTARSLGELLFNESYRTHKELFHASGPGLEVLRRAKAEGRGVLLVSAHLGQWEAIRHFLMSEGMETGAMYRENNNPWYEKRFRHQIEQGGLPIVKKGKKGSFQMVRHVRKGGFFAMMVDQKHRLGHKLPFLGTDAMTTTAPATFALRYGFAIVPCFGIRRENGFDIDIVFEDPIPPGDLITMTRVINDRISQRILDHPDQWYWLHQRWEDLHYHEILHGDTETAGQ